MAQPLQYQSQFVPTDFGVTGNILGMLRQDMQQRDQEFDQAGAIQDKAISEIYGMKTLDPELFKSAGDSLTKAIDEAVSKRGGDYGAAASDISRLISREAKNPIYGLNQRKLEQVAQLEQMLARNPNLLALEDPRKMSLSKQGLTPEDIKYSVADPADIQKSINDIFGDRAKQIREGGLQKSKTPGYLEAITTKGLTTQEMQELLQDPSTREALLARMPQLQGHIDDPNVSSWFNNQMQQGMQGLVGGSSRQFVRDLDYEGRRGQELQNLPSYDNPLKQSGYGLVPQSINDLGSSVFREMGDNAAIAEAKSLNIPGIKSLEDLQKIVDEHDVSKQIYIADKMMSEGFTPGMNYREFTQNPNYDKAKQAIANIETKIGEKELGTGLPTYNIETLMSASRKNMTELEGIQKGFNDAVNKRIDKFDPISRDDGKELENITKEFDILDVSPNFHKDRAGMVLYVQGKDDKNNIRRARVSLKPTEQGYEKVLMKFLNDMNPLISKEYFYAKDGEEYLKFLEGNLPQMDQPSQAGALQFIKEKRGNK